MISHIKEKYNDLKIGTHLKINRGFYDHHALYIGSNSVIHYCGKTNSQIPTIKIEHLDDVAKNDEYEIVEHEKLVSTKDILIKAFSKLNEQKYSVLSNNCEHFVNWCYGNKRSFQVRFVFIILCLITSYYIYKNIKQKK